MFKNLKIVYVDVRVLGDRYLVESSLRYVSEGAIKKAFSFLLKNWSGSAVWLDHDGVSIGYLFDNIEDRENKVITVIHQTLNSYDKEMISYAKAKKDLLKMLKEEAK